MGTKGFAGCTAFCPHSLGAYGYSFMGVLGMETLGSNCPVPLSPQCINKDALNIVHVCNIHSI